MEVKFKQGDSVAIPEGCKAIVKDGSVVFEKEEHEFKDGDILKVEPSGSIIILRDKGGDKNYYYACFSRNGELSIYDNEITFCGYRKEARLATDEEKQLLFDKMKEKGLRWNAKDKRVEKIRWRAEEGEEYYYVGDRKIILADTEDYHFSDKDRHEFGNYFRTKDLAKEAAEAVRETLRKFHEENDL